MYRRILFPLVARADAETVHDLTLAFLARAGQSRAAAALLERCFGDDDPRLHLAVWGLHFSNPLGVAAGLDKNGRAVSALLRMGWGHVEVGTVTPRPQPGNAKPRIFRLAADRALINRMGFPGAGADAVAAHLGRARRSGVVGVNIGANKTSVEAGDAVVDYVVALERLYDVADYLAINVSSPNTARLRALQGRHALLELAQQVAAARDRMAVRKPLLVKLAPDLAPAEIDDIVEVCYQCGIDGLIATNTTVGRPPSLRGAHTDESGGLSGAPLRARATDIIRYLYHSTAARLPIIGAGGVFSAQDAFDKLSAGASLVQIYTGFIYEGPALARRLQRGLVRLMDQHGYATLGDLVGSGRG